VLREVFMAGGSNRLCVAWISIRG